MKFLTDQDIYGTTVRFRQSLGHDVVPVAQIGLASAYDPDLLQAAHAQERIFVTRDRDYGGLVFVGRAGRGVIYLRMLPSNQDAVHEELARVLTVYPEKELLANFVVVEPGRHRFRRVPG